MNQLDLEKSHLPTDMKPEAEEVDLRAAWAMKDDSLAADLQVRHPAFYFVDGNVILSCEDENILFRAHRSILVKGCPALRDLLTDAEYGDRKPDILAGCVHLPLSDTRKDVEALLGIIYHDIRIDTLTLAVDDLPLLSSIYRMATKYHLDRAAADVCARINFQWPSDYTAYITMRTFERAHRRDAPQVMNLPKISIILPAAHPDPPPDPVTAPRATLIHPAHIIALLRAGGCSDPEVLAPLFYALTSAPRDAHALSALPPSDFARYIRGLERVRSFHAQCAAVCPAPENFPLAGTHPFQCWPGIRLFWADLCGALMQGSGGEIEVFAVAREPVELWYLLAHSLTDLAAFASQYCICAECVGRVAERMGQISYALWVQIPRMFDMQ